MSRTMKTIFRVQYRAAIKPAVNDAQLNDAFSVCEAVLREKQGTEQLYTAGLFCWRDMLFLYLELIIDDAAQGVDLSHCPEEWFGVLDPFLKKWPEMNGDRTWVRMLPVFWFDVPISYESFVRRTPPEKRCGRIAILYPDKAMSYICHHQAIVEEGLLIGDRYQFISIHENILFSYFETPREREQVNIKRENGESVEIQRWTSVDPDSHFHRFAEAPNDNFMVIETVVSI